MPNQRTALLVGASGLIGGHCLKFLLNDNSYGAVTLLTRKELPANSPKLRQHIVDFDKLEDHSSIVKGSDVFCCLGTTIKKAGSQDNFRKVDLEYPLTVARIALSNGARQFLLVTAMGANPRSMIFYNRVKGEAELGISKLGYPCLHFFRPSLLLGERNESRTGEHLGKVLFSITSPFFVGPLKKYKAIEGRVVAGSMVACAKNGDNGIFIHQSDQIQKVFDKNLQ